jgi:hypothetical protein
VPSELIERTLNDTGTLLVAGALAGGVAGAMSATLVLIVWSRGPFGWPIEPIVIGGGIGALLGAALFPIALRYVIPRVSLGRAFAGTVAGTVVGGTLAMVLGGGLAAAISGGIAGFLLAVLLLDLASDHDPDAARRIAGEHRD